MSTWYRTKILCKMDRKNAMEPYTMPMDGREGNVGREGRAEGRRERKDREEEEREYGRKGGSKDGRENGWMDAKKVRSVDFGVVF